MKKIKLTFLFLGFGLMLSAQKPTCQDVLTVAGSLLPNGNYDNVRKVLYQTRSTCSSEAAWYYVQYGYQTGVGQVDSALFYMEKGRKLFPKNDSLLFLYAQTCLLDYDSVMAVKGLKAMDEALALNNKPAYQLCKVQLLDAANQSSKALEAIQHIPKAEKNYEVLVEWGYLLQKNNKPKDALLKLNAAIKLDKYEVAAYLQKADLFFNVLNQQDAALAALDTVEMIDSTLADPMLMRAAFFEDHGDFDQAIDEYDQAIQTDSSVHAVYLFRGNCLKEIREFELAEEDFKTYKQKYPHEREVDYMIAELYIAKEDYVGAAQLLSALETGGESSYELYLIRGIAYNDNGQYDDAMKDFNKAENFRERDARLFLNRGICYFNKQDYRNAKYDFERATYLEGDNMEAHYMRCRAAYHAGFFDEACSSCKTAAFHGYEGIEKKYMKGCK